MKQVLLGVGGLALAAVLLASPSLLGLMAVLLGAAASASNANPCMAASMVAPVAAGPVRLPVVGQFQVTSEFGMRSNPGDINTGAYRLHAGLDLAEIPTPGPVVAAMAGVVSSTETTTGSGNEIRVDHGAGTVTGYLHLASRTVTVGQHVTAGEQIGVEGSTGNSSGPHLHFEVRLNGRPVDPRGWLTRQGVSVPARRATATAPPAAPPDARAPAPTTTPVPATTNPFESPNATMPVVSALPAQVGPYEGDQVTNAGYVIRAGQSLKLDAKTITIGVMTAIGESSLINVDHGDAAGPDSRGLFQQRERGWGSYADRMNPTIAATNFYQALRRVPGYLQLEPTIAAHRTQRNADPRHYARFWADAVLMVSTLTADPSLLESLPATGAVIGCADGGPAAPPAAGDGSGAAVVAAARHYLGTPYSWGGGDISGPTTGVHSSSSLNGTHTVGFDCSGLVIFAVHNATGVALTHSAEAQGHDPRGATVARDWAQLQPGDIISFSEDGSGAPGSFGHVGIYAGDGRMIHAPRPGKSVEIVQLRGTAYYERMAWAIKRYTTTRS